MESKNIAAFGTITTTGALTIGSVLAASAATASTAMTVGAAAVAVTAGSVGLASVTAWADPESKDATTYFQKVGTHSAHILPGFIQFIAQSLIQGFMQGLTGGVATNVHRKIAGPDFMTEHRTR